MNTLLLAFAASSAVLTPVPGVFDAGHNNSEMSVEVSEPNQFTGGSVRIVYTAPRSGLEKAGVQPGTVLFEGVVSRPGSSVVLPNGERITTEGGEIRGTARSFKSGCEDAVYGVAGTIDENGRLVLSGPGPTWRQGTCLYQVSADSAHSELVFTVDAAIVPQPEPEPAPVAEIETTSPFIDYSETPETVAETPERDETPPPAVAVVETPAAPAPEPMQLPEVAPETVVADAPVTAEPVSEAEPVEVVETPAVREGSSKPRLDLDF